MVDELNYDTHHPNGDRLYRVGMTWFYDSGIQKSHAIGPVRLGPAIREDVAGVGGVARLRREMLYVERDDVRLYTDRALFGEQEVMDLFGFTVAAGDRAGALTEPYTAVLTAGFARKLFPDGDAIGRVVTVQDTIVLKVTAVLADLPHPSHLKFDLIVSFTTLESIGHRAVTSWAAYWGNLGTHTYVRLRPEVNLSEVEEQLSVLPDRHAGDEQKNFGVRYRHFLQPVASIHLRSDLSGELESSGSRQAVYILSCVARLILIVACVNFVNLSTAQAERRAPEVGLRKVTGARRGQLIVQFLGESAMMTCISVAASLLILELVLPSFNEIASKSITRSVLWSPVSAFSLIVLTSIVSLGAGIYPAFVLSGYAPAQATRGSVSNGRGISIRRALVLLQFVVAALLYTGSDVIERQLLFMQDRDLGIETERVVVVPFRDNPDVRSRLDAIKDGLLQDPRVTSVSASDQVPGRRLGGMEFLFPTKEGGALKASRNLHVDADFIQIYGLELLSGRNFTGQAERGWILNRRAVHSLGIGEGGIDRAVGFSWGEENPHTVIGVVEDFHFAGLQSAIEPLALLSSESSHRSFQMLSARIDGSDIAGSVEWIRETWSRLVPNRPFEFFFLDDDFQVQYRAERRLSRMAGVFSDLAMFIGGLGLFGLVSCAAQRRSKEVGIRKVLGATTENIIRLLSSEFLLLVLVANVVAAPVAYLAMQTWLADFAYRVDPQPASFLLAVATTGIVTLLTTASMAVRSAKLNPADILRGE